MLDGEELGLLDNSGTGDEGGGGDEGGSEEIETFGADEGADQGGGDEGGAEGADDAELGGGDGADRSIVKFTPELVKKGLREVVSTNPDFAKKYPNLEKVVTRALYKDSQLQTLGGLQAVREMAETLEVHGGIEGIEDLANEVEASRELEQGFKAGDPAIIEGWAKDYPQGFKKLILPAVEKLKTLDKPFYDAVVSHVVKTVFDEYGVYSVVAALGEALGKIEAGKDAGALKEFNSLVKWLGDSKVLAANARQTSSTERDAELDERESEISKRDRNNFYASVRMDVNPQVTILMNRIIRGLLPRGAKVRVKVANRLRQEIQAEVRRRVTSEHDFSSKFEKLIDSRNKERTSRFLIERSQKYLTRVTRELLAEFGLTGTGSRNYGNGARRDGANRGGSNNNRVIAGRPKTSEVDFSKTDKARWLSTMNTHGEAWGIDGKLHKW